MGRNQCQSLVSYYSSFEFLSFALGHIQLTITHVRGMLHTPQIVTILAS